MPTSTNLSVDQKGFSTILLMVGVVLVLTVAAAFLIYKQSFSANKPNGFSTNKPNGFSTNKPALNNQESTETIVTSQAADRPASTPTGTATPIISPSTSPSITPLPTIGESPAEACRKKGPTCNIVPGTTDCYCYDPKNCETPDCKME